MLRWREQRKLDVLSFLADPFREKLDKGDMVVKLQAEKYRLSDELFLKFGVEVSDLDVAAKHYDLLRPDSEDV